MSTPDLQWPMYERGHPPPALPTAGPPPQLEIEDTAQLFVRRLKLQAPEWSLLTPSFRSLNFPGFVP